MEKRGVTSHVGGEEREHVVLVACPQRLGLLRRSRLLELPRLEHLVLAGPAAVQRAGPLQLVSQSAEGGKQA